MGTDVTRRDPSRAGDPLDVPAEVRYGLAPGAARLLLAEAFETTQLRNDLFVVDVSHPVVLVLEGGDVAGIGDGIDRGPRNHRGPSVGATPDAEPALLVEAPA